MNLREGTRRLALFVGVFGAILGGFASYLELQNALNQRARHNKFEQLAASDVVQGERKCRLLGYTSGCSMIELPPGATLVKPMGKYTDADILLGPGGPVALEGPDGKTYQFPEGTDKAAAIRYFKSNGIRSDPYAATAEPSSSEVPAKFNMEFATPIASEVNVGEIKTINWSMGRSYGVESIATKDGQTLYPTPAPSRWLYLLAAILPLLGFALPWGLVRAVGWVGAGFCASAK